MIREVEGGITLAVRAQPGARKTAITGLWGSGPDDPAAQLKVALHAPPVEGKANAALIEFLAGFFGVGRNRVEILSGELSRSKVVLVRGVTCAQAERLLAPCLRIS